MDVYMCVCMYVHIYIYTHACVCVCVCVFMYLYMHVHLCTNMRTCLCIHALTYVCKGTVTSSSFAVADQSN